MLKFEFNDIITRMHINIEAILDRELLDLYNTNEVNIIIKRADSSIERFVHIV